jgi:predicted NAD/FAD-binding protein
LLRLFRDLGVATQDSDMSMSVRCDGCGLEYAGAQGARGLFARPQSAVSGRYLRMLGEVLRFHRAARKLLADGGLAEPTLAEFLSAGHYSDYFVQHFMTPVVSCVWSCAPDMALQYPARYLFAFLDNHGMLSVTGSPTWRTVVGGSRSYVEAAAKNLTAVHTATPVRAVTRTAGGVEVRDDADHVQRYDAAVIATHPDQALRLLAEPTPSQQELLEAFTYSQNPTVLHTDTSLLPRASGARASWNYRLAGCDTRAGQVLVSYDMNRLQRIAAPETYVVTLNPGGRVDPTRVLETMNYEHPIYTPTAVAAQRRLSRLNDGVLAFAGAYHGWGFHEDGARSGLAAAQSLGGEW